MSALTKEQIAALPGMVAEATPGPWYPVRNSCYWDVNPVKGGGDDGIPFTIADVCASDPGDSRGLQEKNARLIALAPSLAAAVIGQQAEIERLTAIIAVMDASSPRADRTCAEPGITLSQAVEREYPQLARAALEVKP